MRGRKPTVEGHGDANPPEKPKDLDGYASQMWDTVVEHRRPWLTAADGPALRSLCECWSLRSRAAAVLSDDVANQSARVAFCQYQSAFERMLAKFGLSPTDRERLGVVIDREHDPVAEFIR